MRLRAGTITRQAAKKFQNFSFFSCLLLDDSTIRGRIRRALEGSGNVLSFPGRTNARQNKFFDKLTVKPNQLVGNSFSTSV